MVSIDFLGNGVVDTGLVHATLQQIPATTVTTHGNGWQVRLSLDGGRSHRLFVELWGMEQEPNHAGHPALVLHAPVVPYDAALIEPAMMSLAAHAGIRVCAWMHPLRKRAYLTCAMSFYLRSLTLSELEDGVRALAEHADALEQRLAPGPDQE